MTENVYVIKIKTKPPLSSLYPSERRYSASTVGGMSLIHFILGAISLFLSTMAMSVPGHILSLVCLVPSVTGCLAWRRWYIDRNITIFFYGSLFSSVAGIFCGVIMMYDLTRILNVEESLQSLKTLDVPNHLNDDFTNNTYDIISSKSKPKLTEDHDSSKIHKFNKSLITLEPFEFNVSDFHDGIRNDNYKNLKAFEEKTMILKEVSQDDDTMNITGSINSKKKKITVWHKREFDPNLNKVPMIMNVITASCLEILWSLLSAQIAFNGMMNLPESGNIVAGSKTTKLLLQKKKSPALKPDILNHDNRLSESLQNFTTLQSLAGLGPRLPLPESNREFRERVERFLANQATHRVVEGA